MREIIIIAGKTFPTKTALKEHVRGILYGNEAGKPIKGDDFAFLASLLKRHPNSGQKIGPGIAEFYTGAPPNYPGQLGFWLSRVDGTKTDWSFLECIAPTRQRAKVLAAFRGAIAHQVIDFKASQKEKHGSTVVCPVSQEAIRVDDSHVDHQPPDTFLAIVERFLVELGLDYDDIALDRQEDRQTVDCFTDLDLAHDWTHYHRRHARLRLVSKRANLSTLRIKKPVEPTP